jgi:hypothetical protein
VYYEPELEPINPAALLEIGARGGARGIPVYSSEYLRFSGTKISTYFKVQAVVV